MSKSGYKHSSKVLKPGRRAPASGVYEVVGGRSDLSSERVAVARGKPLPPIPKSGAKYTLRAKSGRYIIKSPVESTSTVAAWSYAFKKK